MMSAFAMVFLIWKTFVLAQDDMSGKTNKMTKDGFTTMPSASDTESRIWRHGGKPKFKWRNSQCKKSTSKDVATCVKMIKDHTKAGKKLDKNR